MFKVFDRIPRSEEDVLLNAFRGLSTSTKDTEYSNAAWYLAQIPEERRAPLINDIVQAYLRSIDNFQ